MDFGTLLSVAQKNENNAKQPAACYQTKFAPPKKQNKQSRSLSENIKKFLARKEEEERQKALEEKKKKENLLALRDHKAQSRINKHLKVCKAANKSVLADAIDNENTAVTMAGPSQPDEDDYGYVSQEASAFYNQLMSKYNTTSSQKPAFSSGKKTVKDIASTKDRVKQALKQQEIDEALGHRRKRKSQTKDAEEEQQPSTERDTEKGESEKQKEEKDKPKKRKMAPPPMDFGELLKIAEKKQHEPIVIQPKPKPKVEEPERLMTKKQMKEYAKEKEWRERREKDKSGDSNKISSVQNKSKPIPKIPSANKTPTKIPTIPKKLDEQRKPNETKRPDEPKKIESSRSVEEPKKPTDKGILRTTLEKPASKSNGKMPDKAINKVKAEKDKILEERRKLEEEKKKIEEMKLALQEEMKKLAKTKKEEVKPEKPKVKIEKKEVKKEVPKPSASAINGKPKQFPPPDLKPIKKPMMKDMRRPMANKRRIYEDDEEYDSELDDFIDDEVQSDEADYSKYISEIFGYDKSKYRNIDDDDTAMESSFAQQLKEEYVSTKIGIMEDLEDIRMEALEKKRKAMLKKKIKK